MVTNWTPEENTGSCGVRADDAVEPAITAALRLRSEAALPRVIHHPSHGHHKPRHERAAEYSVKVPGRSYAIYKLLR
jgi:hypothetical protein